ncbi:M23 family metallopeptidase [Oceanibaculum sp.]|uniref:M23 family metallopeptidase n=1 Tax=Oceanibaculum sp. TaxID=1903597 RepID=UPI002589497F|nr:M23 family metallopeptidase [Oceanibaculum sp.]MCH2393439.1 M23 family metallopeptidase [Oceanibaculum sp.]
MRLLVAFFILCLSALPAAAQSGQLSLEGKPIQGGLMRGKTAPGATVTFDGKTMRVAEDGVFLIGFGREAPAEMTVEVRLPSGRALTRTLQVEQRSYDVQRIDGLPQTMVTPPPELLARIRSENAEIQRARDLDTAVPFFRSGFIWPALGRISGIYGSQRILNGQPRQPHYGIDIAAPKGTRVVTPADGVVALVHPDMYYTGATIVIDHGHGLTSAFLHLDETFVEVGEIVRQGQRIATVGSSGRSTGAHLDWRVNLFDIRLDPALLAGPMPKTGAEEASPASAGAAKATAPGAPAPRTQ